ncbi:MAG: ATP-binding protein [Acidobacteriota bacterium]|nr:ATP-binding protein [Acidobacteriota bacterium]
MTAAQRLRVGLRREVVILVPVALILLVLLSTFTLFSYRGAIRLLQEESQQQSMRTAARLAELFAGQRMPTTDELRRVPPHIVHLALVATDGSVVFERGPESGADLLAGLSIEDLAEPMATGPTLRDGWITALAPIVHRGARHSLRIDVEAEFLSRQMESVRVLTWLVLGINGGLATLVLLFLRHFLTPYDTLIARARELLPEARPVEDEMTFLVSSFERAVETLRKDADSSGDELLALERTLGPSLESGLLLINLSEEVLALNRAGAAILGVVSPTTPTPLALVLGDSDRSLFDLIHGAITSEQLIQRRELPFRRDDEQLTLGLSLNPLRRDDGSTRAFLVLFADLTETNRQAEEERVAASLTQVGELAAGVAHEMRNSLATFRGYLTLAERSPDEESIADYLTELRRETDHLHRVLEDFLSFARPQSTRLEAIDLGVLVTRAASDPAMGEYPIVIDAIPATIKGDEQLLERALRNILHNAVQACADLNPPHPVEVTMRSDGERVEVRVVDRGAGVPAEIRDTVFQPFVTGKSTGVGLGLALAHRIIDLHGGRIGLEEHPPGGTIAVLELPMAPGPGTSTQR